MQEITQIVLFPLSKHPPVPTCLQQVTSYCNVTFTIIRPNTEKDNDTLRSLLRLILATNTILSVVPVCSLHVHMKAIAHANNWSVTLAFHIIFTQAPVNFTWAWAQVCPGVAMPLVTEKL